MVNAFTDGGKKEKEKGKKLAFETGLPSFALLFLSDDPFFSSALPLLKKTEKFLVPSFSPPHFFLSSYPGERARDDSTFPPALLSLKIDLRVEGMEIRSKGGRKERRRWSKKRLCERDRERENNLASLCVLAIATRREGGEKEEKKDELQKLEREVCKFPLLFEREESSTSSLQCVEALSFSRLCLL